MIWLGLGIADFVLTSYRTTPLSAIDFALLKSVWSILQVYLDIWQIVLVIVLFTGILDGPLIFLRSGLLDGLQAVTLWPLELLFKISH